MGSIQGILSPESILLLNKGGNCIWNLYEGVQKEKMEAINEKCWFP